MTNDCNSWLDRLLEEGEPASVIKEFKNLYNELMLCIATNESFTKDDVFNVIKSIGDSDVDAVNAKIYLAYVIGKFQASDAYACAIANNLSEDSTQEDYEFMNRLIDEAVKEVIKR